MNSGWREQCNKIAFGSVLEVSLDAELTSNEKLRSSCQRCLAAVAVSNYDKPEHNRTNVRLRCDMNDDDDTINVVRNHCVHCTTTYVFVVAV